MKISFEQFGAFKKNLLNLPRFLAENAFFFTLGLIALAVGIALLTLFLSLGSLEKGSSQSQGTSEFKEELFLEVFGNWEQREADFVNPNTPNIPKIF